MHRDLTVVCFCAAWCRTCDDYQLVLETLRQDLGQHVNFRWLDIEDESERVGDIDIDNFPTLLISTPSKVHFFGTVLPFAATAHQLIERALRSELPLVNEPTILALNQRVHTPN
jgi:thioredoxin-like negative regulator of GroEL